MNDIQTAVMRKGNVTFAAVDSNGTIGIGMATCMHSDKFSEEIGAGIAIARALKSIADAEEKVWLDRSITKKEWNKKHGKS